jgi:hypothetical protein
MAYTKYSLTPADNNAAPPNGAPEGMLPSGVNDTMRDMMSQIRDVGDGIRGGTYTMTAPVITGGSITGATLSSVSPAFTGTPTAPTASAGTNTTQIATTAFVTAAAQALYPVGSIYINATSSTNPATLLGFGTWSAFGAGRVMVGLDASDALFDTAEETGGSKNSVLVSHTHTASVSDPGHRHGALSVNAAGGSDNPSWSVAGAIVQVGNAFGDTAKVQTGISVSNSTEGSSGTNANLQPYITVRMWKRTA